MGNCAGNELERWEMQAGRGSPGEMSVGCASLTTHQLLKEKYSDHRAGWKCCSRTGVFPPSESANLLNPSCFAPADFKDAVTNPRQVMDPSSLAVRPERSHTGSILVLFLWEGGDSTQNVKH